MTIEEGKNTKLAEKLGKQKRLKKYECVQFEIKDQYKLFVKTVFSSLVTTTYRYLST
jgi:hypothetical protein